MDWKATFEPQALVTFTNNEVRVMMECSAGHYDGYCRSISSPGSGSFLYGMSHQLGDTLLPPMQHCLTFRKLDTLAKCLEQCGHLPQAADQDLGRKLRYRLQCVMGALNDMTVDGMIAPRSLLQGVVKEFEGAIPVDGDAADALLVQIQHLLKS